MFGNARIPLLFKERREAPGWETEVNHAANLFIDPCEYSDHQKYSVDTILKFVAAPLKPKP